MPNPKITLYVDIVSPFAYLAFYMLENFPAFQECEITYVPVFLAGLMKKTGNRPPLEILNKDKWIDADRRRWAQHFQIPILSTVPDSFPANTIHVMRALAYISLHSRSQLPRLIGALYTAFWVRGEPVASPEVFYAVLAGELGEEEAKKVVEGSQSAEVKEEVKRATDEALAEGAFGLPWFVAVGREGKKEAFWGVDHMGMMGRHLGIEMPRDGGWRVML